jgi:hypothetical protein
MNFILNFIEESEYYSAFLDLQTGKTFIRREVSHGGAAKRGVAKENVNQNLKLQTSNNKP